MQQVSKYPLQLTSPVFELDFTAVFVVYAISGPICEIEEGTRNPFYMHFRTVFLLKPLILHDTVLVCEVAWPIWQMRLATKFLWNAKGKKKKFPRRESHTQSRRVDRFLFSYTHFDGRRDGFHVSYKHTLLALLFGWITLYATLKLFIFGFVVLVTTRYFFTAPIY